MNLVEIFFRAFWTKQKTAKNSNKKEVNFRVESLKADLIQINITHYSAFGTFIVIANFPGYFWIAGSFDHSRSNHL